MGESSLVLYPSPYDRDPPLTASWSFMISSPITKHDQSFRGSQRSSLILPIKNIPNGPMVCCTPVQIEEGRVVVGSTARHQTCGASEKNWGPKKNGGLTNSQLGMSTGNQLN
jgi:hypothetical protein